MDDDDEAAPRHVQALIAQAAPRHVEALIAHAGLADWRAEEQPQGRLHQYRGLITPVGWVVAAAVCRAWRDAIARALGAGAGQGETAAWHARAFVRAMAAHGSGWDRAWAEGALFCLKQRVPAGQLVLVRFPTGLRTSAAWPAALRGDQEMAGPGGLQAAAAWPLRRMAGATTAWHGPPAGDVVLVPGAVVGSGAGTAGARPSEWRDPAVQAAARARCAALGVSLGSAADPPFEV